jgi:hypothetical protein
LDAGTAVFTLREHEENVPARLTKWSFRLVIAILGAGIFPGFGQAPASKDVGIAEHNYATYVEARVKYGLLNYGHAARRLHRFAGKTT